MLRTAHLLLTLYQLQLSTEATQIKELPTDEANDVVFESK